MFENLVLESNLPSTSNDQMQTVFFFEKTNMCTHEKECVKKI
jgi:hypothetical protein